MKMIRSTSSTSMSGVTFMSALACGISPVTTRLGAEVLVSVRHYLPPAGAPRLVLALGDQADVLDPRLAQVVHRLHDRRVRGVLVALDQHDALGLVLELAT